MNISTVTILKVLLQLSTHGSKPLSAQTPPTWNTKSTLSKSVIDSLTKRASCKTKFKSKTKRTKY